MVVVVVDVSIPHFFFFHSLKEPPPSFDIWDKIKIKKNIWMRDDETCELICLLFFILFVRSS